VSDRRARARENLMKADTPAKVLINIRTEKKMTETPVLIIIKMNHVGKDGTAMADIELLEY